MVADREGVGERVVVGQVGAAVVPHRQRAVLQALGLQVLAHEAVLGDVVRALAVLRGVEVEGVKVPAVALDRVARLREDGQPAAVAQPPHVAVAEPADPPVGSEVVVERPVLLDEDHDVLHVAEAAGADRRRERAAQP